jgi:hypothetical protein
MEKIQIYIKENSWIAKFAAYKLGTSNVAIVIGRTIHLHNATRNELLENEAWLRHEIAHVKQWLEHNYVLFPILYVWNSIRFGYKNNPFEQSARIAETEEGILENILLL